MRRCRERIWQEIVCAADSDSKVDRWEGMDEMAETGLEQFKLRGAEGGAKHRVERAQQGR